MEEAVYLSTRLLVFSSRPGRTAEDVEVLFGPARSLDNKFIPEFMLLKRRRPELLEHEQGSGFDRDALPGWHVQQASWTQPLMTQRYTRMMQLNRIPVAATALWLASLAAANAHPGHRLGEHGVSHVVTSPYHLLVLGLVGVGLFAASRFVQRQMPRRVLQGAGFAALALTAALWGLRA